MIRSGPLFWLCPLETATIDLRRDRKKKRRFVLRMTERRSWVSLKESPLQPWLKNGRVSVHADAFISSQPDAYRDGLGPRPLSRSPSRVPWTGPLGSALLCLNQSLCPLPVGARLVVTRVVRSV